MSAVWDCERAARPAGGKENENDSRYDRLGTRQHEFDGCADARNARARYEAGGDADGEGLEEAREESEGSCREHESEFAGGSGCRASEEVIGL